MVTRATSASDEAHTWACSLVRTLNAIGITTLARDERWRRTDQMENTLIMGMAARDSGGIATSSIGTNE